MKIIIKLLLAAALFLLCNTKLLAQESINQEGFKNLLGLKQINDRTVDSVAEKTGDLTTAESPVDTALKANKFEADSLHDYKQDKDFAYMKYMDSLLRKTKDLSVDTFSVSNSNIRRQKKPPKNSEERTPPPNLNFFSMPIVKLILWILAIFLIGFIIYKLFLGENFFRRNRSYKNTSDIQKEEEDISDPSGYDTLIAQAVMNKNYRLAIRYSYLQALHKLAGSGLLQFAADKTNYQYVNELRGKPYQNDFAAITLNYEYVWYGKFEIDENIYNRLSGEYRSFNQKL
ncbi:MAG TPA: LapA family protein [Chitinophagaceae bacterium]